MTQSGWIILAFAIGLAAGWLIAHAIAAGRRSRDAEHVNATLAPVQTALSQLNGRLGEIEKGRAALTAELHAQVNLMAMANEGLRRETGALTTALRTPQVRGSWGETQLHRVAEIAGMVDHCDFVEQETTRTSADDVIRPDMKVLLGDGRFCYVDSKAPLAAFLDAQLADDEDEREADLRRFADNVRVHIDQLSAKGYWKAGPGTPEFVVLFLPSDALATAALGIQPDLLDYASQRNIVLATPTSLIGLLRAISYGWKQSALTRAAGDVITLGRELYDRLARLGGLADALGQSLTRTVDAYNKTIGSLEGRVLVTARKLGTLEVSDKQIDAPRAVETTVRSLSAGELLDDVHARREEVIG
ncbi:MAG: DNA recombination protein RmuC [Propionibacteriaceae bacterium]|nr:DNA recombination protein RmuC [Propionibacteriaceae bacterium]